PPIALDPRRFPCMGAIFHKAGYETGYFGKWHLPYPEAQSEKHGFTGVNRGAGKGDMGTAAAAVEFISARRQAPFLLVASFLNPHNIGDGARGGKLSEGPTGDPPPVEQCPPLRPNHDLPGNETDTMVMMRQSYQATPTYPVGNFDEKKWREYLWA